ncbi:hypothetical protein Tco_1024892 [Tanacetum coccineum]
MTLLGGGWLVGGGVCVVGGWRCSCEGQISCPVISGWWWSVCSGLVVRSAYDVWDVGGGGCTVGGLSDRVANKVLLKFREEEGGEGGGEGGENGERVPWCVCGVMEVVVWKGCDLVFYYIGVRASGWVVGSYDGLGCGLGRFVGLRGLGVVCVPWIEEDGLVVGVVVEGLGVVGRRVRCESWLVVVELGCRGMSLKVVLGGGVVALG